MGVCKQRELFSGKKRSVLNKSEDIYHILRDVDNYRGGPLDRSLFSTLDEKSYLGWRSEL